MLVFTASALTAYTGEQKNSTATEHQCSRGLTALPLLLGITDISAGAVLLKSLLYQCSFFFIVICDTNVGLLLLSLTPMMGVITAVTYYFGH